jgi:hypothetical protein
MGCLYNPKLFLKMILDLTPWQDRVEGFLKMNVKRRFATRGRRRRASAVRQVWRRRTSQKRGVALFPAHRVGKSLSASSD